jgi:hypothetical protein
VSSEQWAVSSKEKAEGKMARYPEIFDCFNAEEFRGVRRQPFSFCRESTAFRLLSTALSTADCPLPLLTAH